MTSIRMLAVSVSCSTLLSTIAWPNSPALAQTVERGVEGGAVGAIIGGIVGGGKGAATGAAIGAGIGVLSGAAEENARAQGYYGPPPPPPGYYGPPPPPPGYYPAPAVDVSITVAPPPLPVYDQPFCPGPGYVWTPGYWAYSPGGYYWVPGTWVLPPAVGLLWTPGYWGYEGARYVWHDGYWGPHVGYYGGVNYGFGYFGAGYEGGYWNNGVFFYNTAVTRVNTTLITNTYERRIEHNVPMHNVSFNGPGGINAQPTPQELTWAHERHTPPTALQVKHRHTASTNRALFASVNHGSPFLAATPQPGQFKGADTGKTKGAPTAQTAATNPTTQGNSDWTQHGGDHKGPRYGFQGFSANGAPGPTNPHNPPGVKGPFAAPGGQHGNKSLAQGAPQGHDKKPKHDKDTSPAN